MADSINNSMYNPNNKQIWDNWIVQFYKVWLIVCKNGLTTSQVQSVSYIFRHRNFTLIGLCFHEV